MYLPQKALIIHFSLYFLQPVTVPHTRPSTPRTVTHTHDEDYSEEESDPNNKSDGETNDGKEAGKISK